LALDARPFKTKTTTSKREVAMKIREVCVRYLPGDVPLRAREKFSNSHDVFNAFQTLFLEPVEVFRIVILDSKNRMLFYEDVSRGSLATSVVHPRDVLWSAVHHRAAAIICLHNHPSGDPQPSKEDRECTRRLFNAGKLLGIKLLDHIVIGETEYFSFADAGLLSGEGINE
jgi:DNA repair protein RadC